MLGYGSLLSCCTLAVSYAPLLATYGPLQAVARRSSGIDLLQAILPTSNPRVQPVPLPVPPPRSMIGRNPNWPWSTCP